MRLHHPSLLALVPALLGACGSGASTSVDPAGSPVAAPPGSSPGMPAPPVGTVHPGRGPVEIGEAGGAPYPIVLLHGMGGFDQLKQPIDLEYFNDVIADLASIGETQVFATTAPPYDTSEDRAAAIAPQIAQILKQTGKAKVNLVGHSQGGMDARVLVSPHGMALGAEIASVTTVATPHQGSLVADAVLGLLTDVPPATVQQVTSAALSLLEQTAYQVQTNPQLQAQLTELSQAYMTSTFNPKYIDDPSVPYSSYGGRTNLETGVQDCTSAVYADDPTRVDDAQPEIQPLAQFLQGAADVTNDGLVTVASARWGTFLQCVPADHLKEVGQIAQAGADPVSGFDHLLFYRNLVARIRAAGN
jgi:triacylglycerol lipase